MSSLAYNELITKTFRDNAIRSVMMIDDHFLPYDELCNPGFSFDNLSPEIKQGTEKAASIHRFFQKKKIVCDVDKGANNIDVDKIRKCDLVILDYHLEHEDPKKSLKLLKSLSETEHMNLVVVYTREDLEKVWLSAAACLVGSLPLADPLFVENEELQKYWDNKTEYSTEIPVEWAEKITTEDVVSYVCTGTASTSTVAWYGQNLKQFGKPILAALCERRIRLLNLLKTTKSNSGFIGENSDRKWFQIGNVFVVFHKKTVIENEDEPEQIWNAIQSALHSWQPTYYQLLISEMQNRLENEAISFAKNLKNDLEGQAAWLHEILKKDDAPGRAAAFDQLFERVTDELRIKLYENEALRDHSIKTFDSLEQIFNETKGDLLDFSAAHVKMNRRATLKLDVGHALNYALCTRDFDGAHVTSGTVLHDKDEPSKWYLCVAPACETVPMQATGLLAKRLKPHRLMKVLVLEKMDIAEALVRATDSNCIFVKNSGKERIALSVLNRQSSQPVVDYALIKNHDSSSRNISKHGIVVSFLDLDDKNDVRAAEKTLLPVSQLRDMYTARYQAIASHHTGRVGVDFVSF